MQTLRTFIVGPPVHDVERMRRLLQVAFSEVAQQRLQIDMRVVQDAVSYMAQWSKGSKTRAQRAGMGVLDLWCVDVSWYGYGITCDDFSILVEDADFHGGGKDSRADRSPAFETFLIACPKGGRVSVGNVFHWRVSALEGWQSRASWHAAQGENAQLRAEALHALCQYDWVGLLNFDALIPSCESVLRRSGFVPPSNSARIFFEKCKKLIRPDYFPSGLSLFLAACARRPQRMEELLRGVWEYERNYSLSPDALCPTWMLAVGLTKYMHDIIITRLVL